MKPYGREKKVTGGNSWKIDYHLHPKHKVSNWWEAICNLLPRTTIKKRIKDDIERDLDE